MMSAFDDVASELQPPSSTAELHQFELSKHGNDHDRDTILSAARLVERTNLDLGVFREQFTPVIRQAVTSNSFANTLLSFVGDEAKVVLDAIQRVRLCICFIGFITLKKKLMNRTSGLIVTKLVYLMMLCYIVGHSIALSNSLP
jgi:hypothetical protein